MTTTPAWFQRHRVLLIAVLLLAATAGGSYWLLRKSPAPTAPAAKTRPPVTVEVVAVQRQDAVRTVSAVGTLQANESVVIASEIAGRVSVLGAAEGTAVTAGQELFRLDDSVARAELDQAEASRVLHLANYRRAEALLSDKATSQRERDEAYAQWQYDEARVRLARTQLEKTHILAPFAGTLGLRQVSVGDYVKAGQSLINLEDIAQLKVDFSLPELYAAQVAVGRNLQLTTEARPGEIFTGELYAINPRIDAASRSLTLRGRLDNRAQLLQPGQFVRVTLELGRQEGALFVPEQAVVPHLEQPYVWKVVDNKAAKAKVVTGQRRSGQVEILQGLQPGDVVITGGIQKIGDGAAVKPVAADPKLLAPAGQE